MKTDNDLDLDLLTGHIDDLSENFISQKKSQYMNLVPLGEGATW